MKNLFKNLMLVAVAAMAFTACQNDNNEVNEVNRVTRYEFTANIADDTRSGFAEKEEGATAYKSEWHEGDEVKVFIDNYGAVTTDIDTEGNFELELTNAPEPFFMTVCAPAEAWTGKTSWTVPTEQTPLANSVDPKAHILRSNENILVSNGTPNEKIVMSHYASYGKMTVKGVDFEIKKVEVSFNGGQVYTINATNVENNTFWFAISDSLTVSEFTVTAYGEGDAVVTKTVSMEGKAKPLAFSWGRVSTFSVKDLEVPAEPVFTSAYVDSGSAGDCYIAFEGDSLGKMILNAFKLVTDNWEIMPDTYKIGSASGDFYNAGYSHFTPVGGAKQDLDSGTVKVSIVDRKYCFEFVNVKTASTTINTTYVGTVTGLNLPDLRTTLDVPTNVKATVSGKTITLTWNPVDNVDGYKVWMFSPDNEAITEIVEGTQYVFEAQKGNTQYHFNVYSYASDENPTYKTSTNWVYVTATTEDTDPKMEVSESQLAFSADGGEKTFNVTLKNFTADITYTQEGDWFSVEMSGNTFTVTAEANESETDARNGSITVTAGELSQPITITQSKKPSASTGGGDSGDSDAINLDVLEMEDYMPAKYSGYCNFCLVDAEGKNFIRVEVNDYPLLETTYVYSASYAGWDSGTFFGPGTYISLSGPNSAPGYYSTSVNPKDGGKMTVTKTGDNDNYHIVFDFELPDGTKYNAVFDGQINFI